MKSFIRPFKYLRDVDNDHKIGETLRKLVTRNLLVKGISVLLFIASLFPDLLCVKHLVVILILVYSFQICLYYFCEFVNKSIDCWQSVFLSKFQQELGENTGREY